MELEAKVFKFSLFLNSSPDAYFITVLDLLEDKAGDSMRNDFIGIIMKMPLQQLSDTEYQDILRYYTLYGFPPIYRKYPDGTFTNFDFYNYLLNNIKK
ncbi:MAG: hypothetical protein LBB62_05270 [Proteiniphilum sp.]|nr:hypothetical protein [Proteiniphilum sp.]